MFHILIENSTPNHLVGGPWTGINFTSSAVSASIMECGLRGGQVREALNHKEIKQLTGSGKLKTAQACKACLRKAKINYGKTED